MAAADLTAARLRELLHYDPLTGIFTRLVRTAPNAQAGRIAGGHDACGYLNISVDKRVHKAHRLAWLYVYGHWPLHEIDHINGTKDDNRISNLRDVDRTANGRNFVRVTARNKHSGVLGVTFVRSGGLNPWKAAITVSKRRIHIGVYPTIEAAHEAYVEAKRRLHSDGCTL